MIKTLKPTEESYIQFTEEELKELNLSVGDKFSVHHHDDGSIILKKFSTIEIDMNDFDRKTLEFLVKRSCEKDVSVNEIISDILTSILEH
jgi:hypothetical protein